MLKFRKKEGSFIDNRSNRITRFHSVQISMILLNRIKTASQTLEEAICLGASASKTQCNNLNTSNGKHKNGGKKRSHLYDSSSFLRPLKRPHHPDIQIGLFSCRLFLKPPSAKPYPLFSCMRDFIFRQCLY